MRSLLPNFPKKGSCKAAESSGTLENAAPLLTSPLKKLALFFLSPEGGRQQSGEQECRLTTAMGLVTSGDQRPASPSAQWKPCSARRFLRGGWPGLKCWQRAKRIFQLERREADCVAKPCPRIGFARSLAVDPARWDAPAVKVGWDIWGCHGLSLDRGPPQKKVLKRVNGYYITQNRNSNHTHTWMFNQRQVRRL